MTLEPIDGCPHSVEGYVTGQRSVLDQGSAGCRTGRTLGVPGGVSVLVIREPAGDGLLRCGDEVLTSQPPPACSAIPEKAGTVWPGLRLADPASGLEVVCTRAGHGVLTFAGRPMQLRGH